MARRLLFYTRVVCLTTLCVLLAMTFGSRGISQGSQTIGGYELVSETPQMKPTILYTYRATLTNTGPALGAATATITSAGNIKIVDGTLIFGPVGSGGVVTSSDTFSFIRNPNQKLDFSKIMWSISATPNRPPVANAGPDQTRQLGDTAPLDGSSSSDADGNALTYLWSFVSRPAGSLAVLSDPTAIAPTFAVDQPGSYVVQLVVNDGFANSAADTVTIATSNSAPVAHAGPDQTAFVTQTVTLNGSGSSDADGNTLTFAWSFVNRPPQSAAVLTNPTSVMPTFVVDVPGTYLVQLVVNDGFVNSSPDTVSITTQNSPPVANAGADQTVFVGSTVTLDGSGSTDVDGDSITYAWALTSAPSGSAAALNTPTAVQPTFLVDRPGTYVAQLIVSDGSAFSAADTVTITTENSRPVANAGSDHTARTGQLVLLDGTGSTDVDGDPLTFRWSFTSIPAGSTASLTAADSAGPSFIVDRLGSYTLQLIVNDGSIDSTPDTVTITTTNSAPTANAGPDQIGVTTGTLLTLDGSQSSDPDNQPLTYSWALITRPAGSSAEVNGATTAFPSFTPDVAGDYVAQLVVNDGLVDSAPDTVLISASSPPTVAPVVTLDPVDLTVTAGETATFTAAATGTPSPSVQWQSSADGGATFTDVDGATSSTLSFLTVPSDHGRKFQALFTNSAGTAVTTAATLTVIDNRPVVTIAAVDPVVTEYNADPGVFTVNRAGGDLGSDLVVLLELQGTATADVDFTLSANVVGISPRTITIPAGQLSATVTVTAIDDVVADGGETVVLTVVPGAAYAIGTPAAATVTIYDDALVVTNTNDTGAGSLRQALLEANLNSVFQDTIRFAIPGSGPHTIVPASPLPTITAPVVIDGTTQPGYVAFQSMIEIDGTNAGPEANGLVVAVGLTRIHGLVINRFGAGGVEPTGGSGIRVVGPDTYNIIIQQNVIGADVTSFVARPNRGDGIGVDSAYTMILGNQIAFNGGAGISLAGTSGSLVASNGIRTNTGAGVSILSGSGHFLSANGIDGNGGLGIDLGNDGVTPNDPDDADTGPNDLQNFPVVTSARSVDGTTTITGTLTSTPNSDFTVQLFSSQFSNQTCDPSGHGQGGFAFGSVSVTTDAAGHGQFTFTIEFPLWTGTFVTATASTASSPSGTSEFSTCLEVNALINLFPAPLALLTRDSGTFEIQLSRPAGPGPMTVSLTTSDAAIATVPEAVVIPEGDLGALVPVTTGTTAGTATIAATAPQFHAGSGQVVVSRRPMTLTMPGPLVGVGHVRPGTVTLAQAAPTGGVTITLASGDSELVSVPSSVFVPQGSQSVSFSITGMAVGSATISASADGYETANLTVTATTHVVTLTALGPAAAELNTFAGVFTVTRAGGDLGSDLVVAFEVQGTATAGVDFTFSPNVVGTSITIPGGQLSATITVTPIDDAVPEGSETIVLALVPSVTYAVGTSAAATVTIDDDDLLVTNTNDAGAGSLRQALLDANAHVGVLDTIRFAIPGDGPHTIVPASPLPTITDPVVIDGTSQPGHVAYQSMIEIDGTNAGPEANGLVVAVGFTRIHALVINRFGAGGVEAVGGSGIRVVGPNTYNIIIQGNVIGADVTGLIARPNRGDGIRVDSAFAQVQGNFIAFNEGAGISLAGTSGSFVVSNGIRTNTGAGISILSGSGHFLSANGIEGNGGLGIDLGNDGVTPNDADDADTGPNDLQNFPVVTSARSVDGTTTVTGTLVSTPNSDFTVQLFSSQTCDPSRHGQGGFVLGSVSVTTDAAGYGQFAFTREFFLADGTFVTATATTASSLSGTSEFSACLEVNALITLVPASLELLTRDGGSLVIQLSRPAGPGPMTVNLTTSDATIATVPESVVIPEGDSTASVPVTTGTTAGTATIAATAHPFQAGSGQVVVSLRPMTVTAPGPLVGVGHTLPGTVTLAQPAPAGGVTIALASGDSDLVSVPSSVFIPQGSISASFLITGVAVGSTTISATADGFETGTLAIESTAIAIITLGSGVVAPGLNTSLALSIGIPAPPGGVTITLTSSDPAIVSVVTPTVFIPEGLQIPAVNPVVHGVAIGTAQITATTATLAPDTAAVNVTLSASLAPDPLTIVKGQTGEITLAISAPAPPGGLTFSTSSDNSAFASVPPTAHIGAGSTSVQVVVTGVAVGSTTLRANAPGIAETTAAVVVTNAPPITVGDVTVGHNLQTALSGSLGAPAPAGNQQVTVTSLDPSKVLLATSASGVGTASITLEVGAGLVAIPTFYVQALAGAGSVQLETTASGYAPDTSQVTLTPSGFMFTPGTTNFSTTTFASNTTLTVVAARLNPADLTYAQSQALRSGHPTVSVFVTSSLQTVGTIANSPAVFDAGDSSANVQFDPAAGGTTTISLVPPAGFTTPSNLQQVSATVTAPNISVNGSGLVGLDLQTSISLSLGVSPPSRVNVTVTSNNPAVATITPTAADEGTATVTFTNVPATLPGTSIGTFFLQGRSIGTTTLTVQAPGYNDATLNVTVQPSGFSFTPGTTNFSTTTFSGNTTLTVVAGRLDPVTLNHVQSQALRGGHGPVTVPVTSSLTTVGTMVNSPAVINAGESSKGVQFDPASGGTTTIAIVPPAGFTTPSNLQQVSATVTAPNISVNGSGLVGLDLQTSISLSLGVSPPSKVNVTVTSNNPAVATITTTAADEGTATVTFTNVPATLPGTSIGTFFLQGRSIGTTTLTVQAPGYNDATLNVTVQPSGFAFTPGTTNFSTTTSASDRTLTVQPFRLDPTFLTVLGAQALRGGLGPLNVSVTSSLTTVGTILGSPAVFDGGGSSSKNVQFHPVAEGATIIAIEQPAGFTTPSNLQQITATVNATVGGLLELDRQTSITAVAGRAAPSDQADTLRVRVRPPAFSFRLGAIRSNPRVSFL